MPLIKFINKNNFTCGIWEITESVKTLLGKVNFNENETEINVFFDRRTYNLIGWQTVDIYQNLSITYLSSITKNKKIKKGIFKLPERNN